MTPEQVMPHGQRARLVQLFSNHTNLRSTVTEGLFEFPPEVGHSFRLLGNALDKSKGDLRQITTSAVTEVNQDGEVVTFSTKNSRYQLTILGTQL